MSDQTLSKSQREDWNKYMDHLEKVGGSVHNPDYLKGFKRDNPGTKLEEDHIQIAVNEVNKIKASGDISGITPDHAHFLHSGLTRGYRNNPNNLRYPVTKSHGTDLEKYAESKMPSSS